MKVAEWMGKVAQWWGGCLAHWRPCIQPQHCTNKQEKNCLKEKSTQKTQPPPRKQKQNQQQQQNRTKTVSPSVNAHQHHPGKLPELTFMGWFHRLGWSPMNLHTFAITEVADPWMTSLPGRQTQLEEPVRSGRENGNKSDWEMTKWDAPVSLSQGLHSGQWSEEWRSHISRGHWRTWNLSELDKDKTIQNVPCAATGPWKHTILKAVLQQRFPTVGKLVSNYRLSISYSKCPRQWSVVSADLGEKHHGT